MWRGGPVQPEAWPTVRGLGGTSRRAGVSGGPWACSSRDPRGLPRAWALTVHASGPGSRGARDLALSARAASRLPGNRPPWLAAVPVQGHNLTGAGGQLTCKRGRDGAEWTRPGVEPPAAPACSAEPTQCPAGPAGTEPAPRGTAEPPQMMPTELPSKRRMPGQASDLPLTQRRFGGLA